MANIEKTVKILFQGDDQVSKVMSDLSGNLSGLSSAASGAAEPWANVADNILKADAALAALAVGGLAYALNKAIEFEGSVVDLNKVLGENPVALKVAADAAIDLSNEYGQAATNILGSTAQFKQAGYTVQEAMQLTKNALDLVIVGDLEAVEASALLVSTLKGFGAPAEEAGRLMDVLNETSNNYATNVQELASGMAGISPIASQMGFSFEETAGILTPVIEVFRSGDEVARAFRTGLLSLTSDTPRVTEALAALGISQTTVNGQMKSGRDVFYEVQQAFSGLTDTEKTYYAQQLVGKDQAAKMALAFDSLNKSIEVTQTAMGSAGSAVAEVNTYLASSPVAVDRFISGFENLSIKVGDQFRDAAKEAINGGTEIEMALQGLIDNGAFDAVFDYIEKFTGDVGGALKTVAENLPEAMGDVDFSGFLSSLDGLGAGFQSALADIWGDLDLKTPEGLAEAVQKVVNGFTALINTTTGVVNGMKPLFVAIGAAVEQYEDLDGSAQELAGTFLGASKTVLTIVENLDLLKWALVPLAGASMVNAIANVANLVKLGSGAAALGGLATASTALGVALAAVALVKGAEYLGETIGKIVANSKEASPAVQKLQDDIKALATLKGDFSIVQGVESLSNETIIAVGQMNALKAAVSGLPEVTRLEVMSTFAREGFDAARLKIDEINGVTAEVSVYANVDTGDLITLYNRLQELPEEKRIEIQAIADAGQMRLALSMLDDIPTQKEIEIKTKTDSIAAAQKAWQTFEVELADGTTAAYTVEADLTSAKKAKDAISEVLDPAKKLEIETELDVAKLEAAKSMFTDLTGVMNTAIEWDAKIDIAAMENETEQVKAAFESIGESVASVSAVVGDMFGSLAGYSGVHFYELLDLTKQELTMQEKLIEAQVRLSNAQAAKIESGEGIQVQVESSNLSPALETIFSEIMSIAQVKANAEGLALLGVGA